MKLTKKAVKELNAGISEAFQATLEAQLLVYNNGRAHRFWEFPPEGWTQDEKRSYDLLIEMEYKVRLFIDNYSTPANHPTS